MPFDEEFTIYVWFDALLTYITGIGYGDDEAMFHKWWPADIHFIGKDITRFHCALWPAMLLAAGVEPPKKVFGHGFVNVDGDEDQQVARQRHRADGDHHEVQRRGVPLLLPARMPVPRRRRVQRAAVRGGVQHRPGEQPRQPLSRCVTRSCKNYRRRASGTATSPARARRQCTGARPCAYSSDTVRGHVEACQYNLGLPGDRSGLPDSDQPVPRSERTVEAGQDGQGGGEGGALQRGAVAARSRASC